MIHGRTPHASGQPDEGADKAQEYLEGWQRSRAELANFQKRMADEHLTREQRAKRSALEPLLSVADNFQAVIMHVPADLQDNAWVQGVIHVARQLDHVLQEQGVTIINPELHKTMFNPLEHEAIGEVSQSDVPSGTVVELVQQGYKLGESVLRPARVKVAA